MNTGISELFNTPPEWAYFHKLGDALGEGWFGIDVLPIMQAITPAFTDYKNLTTPVHLKRSSDWGEQLIKFDFYILPRGITRHGTMGYRVIKTGFNGHVGVLDIDRVLDNNELYGKSPSRPTDFDNTRNLIEGVQRLGLDKIHSLMGRQSRWVHDYRFLIQGAADYFVYLDDARQIAIKKMMNAIDERAELSDGKRLLVQGYLVDALVEFDQETVQKTKQMVESARAQLKRDAVALLAQQPSTQTHRHYRFLTRRQTNAHVNYPILLLADNFETVFKQFDENGLSNSDNNQVIAHLREEHVGAQNARRLPRLWSHRLLELDIHSPKTWDKVSALYDASALFEGVIANSKEWIYQDFLSALQHEDDHPVLSHLYDKTFAGVRAQEAHEWKNYANSLIALRLYTDMQTQGHDMPLSHALYASGFSHPALEQTMQNSSPALRKKLRSWGPNVISQHTKDNGITLIELAYAYALQRTAEDAPIAHMTVSNRLLEHGASYQWGALPDIYLNDDGVYVNALTSQDQLMKSALRYNHDLWKAGPEAITGKSHFIDISNERGSVATAHIREPEKMNGQWEIVDIARHARGPGHNATAAVIEAYLESHEFMARYNPAALQTTRNELIGKLGKQARSHEYLGINHNVQAERAAYLQAFMRFLPKGNAEFGMNAQGCLTSAFLDEDITQSVSLLIPLYKGKEPNTAYKIG